MINVCNTTTGTLIVHNTDLTIIMDISHNRLYKPVQTLTNSDPPRAVLKLRFENKGLDVIRLSNILNNKSVSGKIPPYILKY